MPEILGQTRKRGGSIRRTGGRLVFEHEEEYFVMADTLSQDHDEILLTAGLPVAGLTVHDRALCNGKSATSDPIQPLLWTVTATYSSEVEEGGNESQENQGGDPTAFIPIAELAYESYQDVSILDASGTPVLNSANQPFETGFLRPRTLVRLDFEQFEPTSVTDEDIAERNETVNSAEFKGKAAKTLKLSVRSAAIGWYYGYRVWRIGYSLTYKKDTWRRTRLDIGNSYLSGGTLLPYLDNDGNRIVGNLNGSGAKASVGTAPTILYFDEMESLNFSDFLRIT